MEESNIEITDVPEGEPENGGDGTRVFTEAQYRELKREFPDCGPYEELPEQVRKSAETGERDLLYAYLLYRHGEQRRIAEAEAAEAAADEAATGSLAGIEQPETDGFTAFVSGLFN